MECAVCSVQCSVYSGGRFVGGHGELLAGRWVVGVGG